MQNSVRNQESDALMANLAGLNGSDRGHEAGYFFRVSFLAASRE